MGKVHAALQEQVLQKAADRVFRYGGNQSRSHAETPPQAPGDVVLTAALPDLKVAGASHPVVTGVETNHDLTQA
jgi:hypothetical protein